MNTSTERDRLAGLGFYALAVLLGYFIYQLFRPFLVPLAWAGVLAICFYPTHRKLEHRLRRGPAALVSTLSVAILVIGPMLVIGSAFVSEASGIMDDVPRVLEQMPGFAQRWMRTALRYVPGGETLDVAALIGEGARRVAAFVSAQAAAFVQHVLIFLADLIIMIFALFFLFRDAETLMAALRQTIPLRPDIRERLIRRTQTLVTASVTSGLIVAAVQGILGGLTFWILGLKGPLFWGVVMALFCLLPFGAWVVWAPAAIWLMLTGSVGRGIILVAVGAGVVSAIDNFLRPILLSEQSGMNGLLLFIALLGGVMAFGTVGLILGPVLMAIAIGLFDAFTADAATPPPPSQSPV